MNSDKRWLTAFCPFYDCLSGVLCSWPIRLLAVQGPSLSPVGNPALFLFFCHFYMQKQAKTMVEMEHQGGIFHFSQAFPEQVQEAREEVMENVPRAIRWGKWDLKTIAGSRYMSHLHFWPPDSKVENSLFFWFNMKLVQDYFMGPIELESSIFLSCLDLTGPGIN